MMQGRSNLSRYETTLQQLTNETDQHLRAIQTPNSRGAAIQTEEKEQPSTTSAAAAMDSDTTPSVGHLDQPPLSSHYLARRFHRAGGGGGIGVGAQTPTANTLLSPQRLMSGAGGGHSDYLPPASNDLDYKLESLQLLLNSFKTKMRADFDATFTSVERKARIQRKEILAHVTASLEEVEARLASSMKSNLGDYQLLEIEFRKNLKMDLYTLRNEMESAARIEEEARTDMQRKLKLQESVALELRQKLEELLIGRAGGGGGSLGSGAGIHFDQQLISFQHSLEAMQTKFSLDLMSSRKESEVKNVEIQHDILELRRILESLLTHEEENQRAQVDLIRKNSEQASKEVQEKVDESLSNMNGLLKNLYKNLELTTQNCDVLHEQLSELQARENGTAGPLTARRVTQAQLDALEEKLFAMIQGSGSGSANAATVRELQNTVELHSRKLDTLQSSSRETLEEADLRSRMSQEKFKKEFMIATEGKFGNIILDQEILKRKMDLIQPEQLLQEVNGKVAILEKDVSGRFQLSKDEFERYQYDQKLAQQQEKERHQTLERKYDEVLVVISTLTGQIKDLSFSLTKMKDEALVKEKKYITDIYDLKQTHVQALHTLRQDLTELSAQKEKELRDEIQRMSTKLSSQTNERHGELTARLRESEEVQARVKDELQQTYMDELSSNLRKVDNDMKKLQSNVAEIEAKTRRNEEVMKVAEELARSSVEQRVGGANESIAAASTVRDIQELQSTLVPLQLQVKIVQEKQEQMLRSLTETLVQQSAVQQSISSNQREIERFTSQQKQNDLEMVKQTQNQITSVHSDFEESLTNVDQRLTKELNESRLKIQDLEHSFKLMKKYQRIETGLSSVDAVLSPRGASGGLGASSSGSESEAPNVNTPTHSAISLKDSTLIRQIQLQIEELEFKLYSLTQSSSQLKLLQEDLAPRVDSLEREISDVRKRAIQRDTHVDEALRARVEVSAFDKFKREFTAQTQSQAAATLSTAQIALATAQQAQRGGGSSQPWPSIIDPMATTTTSTPPRTNSPPPPTRPLVRIPSLDRTGSNSSQPGVSPKSVLRRASLENKSPLLKSVHFAETAAVATIPPIVEISLQHDEPTISIDYSHAKLPTILPVLETGHRVLKHFSHGPPIQKLLFYSSRALPNSSTGTMPTSYTARELAPGFIHWVEPEDATRAVLPMTTLLVSRIMVLSVGKHTRAFQKPDSASIPEELCFSVLTSERSLEVQMSSKEVRDVWVRGLRLLLKKHNVDYEFQGSATNLSDSDEDEEQKDESSHPRDSNQESKDFGFDDDNSDEEEDIDSWMSNLDSSKKSGPNSDATPQQSSAEIDDTPTLRERELKRLESDRVFQQELEAERVRQKAILDEQAAQKAREVAEEDARKKARAEKDLAKEAELRAVQERREQDIRDQEAKRLKDQHEKELAAEAERERLAREREREHALAQEAERQKRVAEEKAQVEAERRRVEEAAHAAELEKHQRALDLERAKMAAGEEARLRQERLAEEAAAEQTKRLERERREHEAKLAQEAAELAQRQSEQAAQALRAAEAEAERKRLAALEEKEQRQRAEAEAERQRQLEIGAEKERQRLQDAADAADEHGRQLMKQQQEEEEAAAAAAASHSSELVESEEDEEDEDDDDEKPEWLDPTDAIIQLTLRAHNVPRLGVISKTELVFHISEAGAAPNSQFFVIDRHHLHGLDEDELEEYAAEHPDCLNGIFDLRFPFPESNSVPKKIRIRIYDVLKSSPTARMDNLVGEINDFDLMTLLQHPNGVNVLPKHPTKPDLTNRLKKQQTNVLLMGRMRRNLRERRAAGLEEQVEEAHAVASKTVAATPAPVPPPVIAASTPAVVAAPAPKPTFKPSFTAECNTQSQYETVRRELRQYGIPKFHMDMLDAGWFVRDGADLVLATGDKPFNPFARLVAGKLPAPYGNLLQKHGLTDADQHFFIAQNRPELDEKWSSDDPAWVGKASMAQHHQFMLLKSLHWTTFNVATFAIGGDVHSLKQAIRLLDDMSATAHEYARKAGWSDDLGLFFHCYPFNSVQALHLHMVDMKTIGPTFHHLNHKNLPLSTVRQQLLEELQEIDLLDAEEFEHPQTKSQTRISPATPSPKAKSSQHSFESPISPGSESDSNYHEKGESDDDLALSFSPVHTKPHPPATATSSSSSSAPAATPNKAAVGSMLSADADDSSSEEEEEQPRSLPTSKPAASSSSTLSKYAPASAEAEWDAIDTNSAPTVASAVAPKSASASSSIHDDVSDDDDDVSDESDDDSNSKAANFGRSSGPSLVNMKPLSSIQPLNTDSLLKGGSSRGGLASSLLSKKPQSKPITSLRSSTSALPSHSKSNFKIGMHFDDPVEEEEEEDEQLSEGHDIEERTHLTTNQQTKPSTNLASTHSRHTVAPPGGDVIDEEDEESDFESSFESTPLSSQLTSSTTTRPTATSSQKARPTGATSSHHTNSSPDMSLKDDESSLNLSIDDLSEK